MDPSKPAKLPTSVHPLLYEVHLAPVAESAVFNGRQTVDLQVNERTNKIQLNSKDIEIHKVSYALPDCVRMCVGSVCAFLLFFFLSARKMDLVAMVVVARSTGGSARRR